jgi:tetratricopeptide (TPR) repeat protein
LNSLLAGGVSSYDKVVEAIFSVANKHYNAFSNENRTVQADKRLRNAMEICDILLKEVPQFNPAWIGPEACTLIAESYRRFGEYDKALPYYEKILIDWPLNMYAKNAKFMVGRCYEALKKSGMIDAYTADNETEFAYEQLLQRDPNHPAAGYMSNWLTRYEDELQGNEWK